MNRDFVVEQLAARTELAGASPGFVLCCADGIASVTAVGQAPGYLVDRASYAVEVRQ